MLELFLFCNSPVSQTHYHVVGDDIDSLLSDRANNDLFHESKFVELMDTLRYPGKDYPILISLVEHYGTTGYIVSNIKCLLLQYPTRGMLSMFRYDDGSSTWRIIKMEEIDVQKLEGIVREINDSPYWISNADDGEILEGDALSYRSMNLGADSLLSKFSANPDERLLNRIVELTSLEK